MPLFARSEMTMPIIDTIQLLRGIILSPDCAKMNLGTVKGYLGELLVKQRLQDELGVIRVEHFGNQHSHDLQSNRDAKAIQIDVKTSIAKDEFKWGFPYWSGALL